MIAPTDPLDSGPSAASLVPVEPDSANHFLVGKTGGMIVIQRPTRGYWNRHQIKNLAAWLIVIAGLPLAEVETLCQEIEKT